MIFGKNKKNNYSLFIFSLLVIALLGILSIISADNVKSQEKASIITENQLNADTLKTEINEKNLENIAQIKGAEDFLADFQKNKNIFDLNVSEIPEGYLVSFAGLGNGDTLHPYYGFFEGNQEITKIFWGENGEAKFINKENNQFKIKNTGKFSWNTEENWENYATLKKIKLASETGEKFVQPGEIGIFTSDTEKILPKNADHEYLIVIEK